MYLDTVSRVAVANEYDGQTDRTVSSRRELKMKASAIEVELKTECT